MTNIEVVKKVLKVVGRPEKFFDFVADRPGQDIRYSVNYEKIKSLGWKPKTTLDEYLPICKEQNEIRRRSLPPGRKKRFLQLIGLGKIIKW